MVTHSVLIDNSIFIPQHVDKTLNKHGVICSVTDKFAFVVDLRCFPHFEAQPHSPGKHNKVGCKINELIKKIEIKNNYQKVPLMMRCELITKARRLGTR